MIRSWVFLAVLVGLVAAVVVAKTAFPPGEDRQPRVNVLTAGEALRVGPRPGSDLGLCRRSGRPTLADFGAGTCEQCEKQAPVLERAARDYQGEANVVYVDVAVYPAIAQNFGVKAIPTQIFFDAKGDEVSRHLGYYPPEKIAAEFARLGVK